MKIAINNILSVTNDVSLDIKIFAHTFDCPQTSQLRKNSVTVISLDSLQIKCLLLNH